MTAVIVALRFDDVASFFACLLRQRRRPSK